MFTQEKEIDLLEKMHKDLWLVEINRIPRSTPESKREQEKRPFWEALELLAAPAR